ncbi:MAG: hypothetical protein AB7T63_02840 [Planctomycetota bacterium]
MDNRSRFGRMGWWSRAVGASVLVLTATVLPACGGGGSGGFQGSTPSLSLGSTLLPLLASGQPLAGDGYALPIQGGCGGPYTVRLISGQLPSGISIDDRQANIEGPGVPASHRHHLVGTALEDGSFSFRLEILDRGCKPSVSMAADFTWNVSQGGVTIVDATPPSIPVALYNDPFKYNDVDALDKTVYGDFTSITFVVAGGVGPYTCAIIDDPTDPDDDSGLPFGVVMPPASCSIVGSPQQVGDGGKPFRFTVRAMDSVGQTATRKFQWKIDTPPMIVGSADITDGTAGSPYGDAIQIVDGVPPFKFELTADLPTDLDNTSAAWVYNPPAAPTFPSLSGFTVAPTGEAANKLTAASYPAPAALGPYYPAPPEGLFIVEDGGQAGSLTGVPRRFGSFTINVHAYSATVPNERGQHAFAQFGFDIAPGVPLAMVDTFVVDGNGSNTFLAPTPDGVATLPEFEVLQPRTTQMVAEGGVPFDGYTDAPHASQRSIDFGEVAGTYDWSVSSWDSRGEGWHPGNVPPGRPTGINADITGRIFTTSGGVDLQRQGRQVIEVTVSDRRLPAPQTDVHEMALSVGPDVLIITESRQSCVITTGSTYDSTSHNDSMFIKRMQVVNNSAQVSPLDATDLATSHIVPAAANLNALTNPLGRLLSGVGKPTYTGTGRDGAGADILRVVVNATGWWDDSFQLNPRAARAFSHADADKCYLEYYGDYYTYGAQPDASAVALPDITDGAVVHQPGLGVYTNGGKLYAFENDSHFGVFIIREDGKIYVPFAMQKGTWQGFGDNITSTLQGTGAGAPTDSQMRTISFGISPNGRFGVMKIMASPTNYNETGSQSRVVLLDLAGDKAFSGDTYRLVAMPTTAGRIMADTLTLTNEYLYGILDRSNGGYPYGWLQNNVWRESILAGTGTASFAPGLPSNTASTYLSLPYHNSGTYTYLGGTWNGTTVYTTYYTYSGGDHKNMYEDGTAPIPFRVSADGTTCALMCGPYDGVVLGTTPFMYRAYVDKNGAGFQLASSTNRRAPYGGARAHRLRFGTAYYGLAGLAQWGKHEGPSGNLELSDDGNRLAYGVSEAANLSSGTYYSTYQVYYNLNWRLARMNVWVSSTTNGWASYSETSPTATYFGGSHYWRFGGLSFSRDGDRLFFFGGISQKDAQSTSDTYAYSTGVYNASAWVTGTYYMYDFSSPAQVRSILPTSAGGTGSNTYTGSQPFNPTAGALTTNWGVVAPYGGFWSQDGRFLYVNTGHPMTSSDGTCHRLIGINTTGAAINGKQANTGFEVGSWPTQRGLLNNYSTGGMYYGGMLPYLTPGGSHQLARVKMAEDTGVVFFASHSGRYSGAPSTSYGAVHTQYYSSSYCLDAGHVECFASNVGGDLQRLTQFSNDGTLTSPRGRGITFIEVTDAGDRLVFIYSNGASGGPNENYRYASKEGVCYVSNIQLNPVTGQLVTRTQTLLEGNEGGAGQVGGSTGRAGGSLAFGTDGQRVFYSFGPNATDENQRTFVGPRVDGAGQVDAATTTRYGTGNRGLILHAGR